MKRETRNEIVWLFFDEWFCPKKFAIDQRWMCIHSKFHWLICSFISFIAI